MTSRFKRLGHMASRGGFRKFPKKSTNIMRVLASNPTVVEAVTTSAEFCDSKQLRQLFGLSRSHAYLLIEEGLIRSVSIRRPGTTRGRRLFDCASVRAFLNKRATGGE